MSYILDALRKADAQRERDSSRGIHAHPTPLGTSGANHGWRTTWLWAGAAVVAVAGAGAWFITRDKPAGTPLPAPLVAAAPQPVPLPPPAPSAEIRPAPPVPKPVVDAAPAIVPPARPRTEMPVPHQGGMAPPPQVPAPVQSPTATPAGAPAAVAGLPPEAPRVAISGGVYSPDPAQRMLIVGGQVFNEGSEIAPGLTIEEIKPRAAVLKFRGARYTVGY